MSRRRRAPRRGRRSDYDSYGYSYYPRRRGWLAAVQHAVGNVLTVVFIALAAVAFFLIVLFVAFNLTLVAQLLTYALYVAIGLAALGLVYLIVRIFTAISNRMAEAAAARAHAQQDHERARLARERVEQARVQVRTQQVKLAREEQWDGQPARRSSRSGAPLPQPARRALPEPAPAPDPEPQVQEPEIQETELEVLGMPTKGQVFAYKRYRRFLQPDQVSIGVRKDGSLRVGSWQDLKILLILGSSSSGKSTTVLEKCTSHVCNDGLLVICDPGGFKPDSITQRMGALRYALLPGTIVALEHADIMQNLERFRVELERRRRGADMTTPLLLVIDELNGLLMDKEIKKGLTELVEKFGQQARGYNMYMILCAQRASGLSAIRNSVISFICHKCPEMEASKILPARYARLAPELGVGQTFVSDADGYIEPLQQLYITAQDIAASVGRSHRPQPAPTQPAAQAAPAVPRTDPLGPRTHGAPARRTAQPSLPLAQAPTTRSGPLRRTTLVQAPADATVRQAPQPQKPAPRPARSAGAVWGEETQVQPPRPAAPAGRGAPGAPSSYPTTEDLRPRAADQAAGAGSRQDTFEMLALRRAKKK